MGSDGQLSDGSDGGPLGDTIKQLQAELGDSDEEDVSKAPLPDVSEISTLVSMDDYLKMTRKPETKEFFLKLLARKEKFIDLIQQGKVTAESYRQLVEKKHSQKDLP